MSALTSKIEEKASVPPMDHRSIENFIYREARLQDEHRYDEWEELWADDGVYWVPANDYDIDPQKQISYIYDNRARLASRIRQLKSGRRHAQIPESRMRRVVSNIEYSQVDDLVHVQANFMLCEIRNGRRNFWAGRTAYDIRHVDGEFKLVLKKVMLVDVESPLPNLGFLI